MQLGSILSGATERIVCKPVSFRVLGQDPEGNQVSAQAEAVFAFVSETARGESSALAAEHAKPGSEPNAEEKYWFLMAALRDKDNPVKQFCPNSDIGKFRSALIVDQVIWLLGKYQEFVNDEYPELATKKQREELLDEAAGK